MDSDRPRAHAVAISAGRITAVGSLAECRTAAPGAEVIDTGAAALLPGLIEPHSHPLMSGVATEPPARNITPFQVPKWTDVETVFAQAIAQTDADTPLLFSGFDALLHQRPAPEATGRSSTTNTAAAGRPSAMLRHRVRWCRSTMTDQCRRPRRYSTFRRR
jgi:predicted amidohydrolase YtcJ